MLEKMVYLYWQRRLTYCRYEWKETGYNSQANAVPRNSMETALSVGRTRTCVIPILRRRHHTGIVPLCDITSSMRVTLHGPGANSNIATVRSRDVCYIDGTDTTHDVCYIDGTDTTHDVRYIDGTDTTHDVCYIDGTDTTRDVCYIDGTDTTHDVCYIDGTYTTRDLCYVDGTDTTHDVCYIDGTDTTRDICYIDGTDTTRDVCYIDGTDTTQIPRRFDVQRPAHVQLCTFCANTLRVFLLGKYSCSSVET